jgi:hypothetical protein
MHQRRNAADQFVFFSPSRVYVELVTGEFQLVARELRQQGAQRYASFAADLIQYVGAWSGRWDCQISNSCEFKETRPGEAVQGGPTYAHLPAIFLSG